MQIHPAGVLAVYCCLIVAASLFGGWLPGFIRLTHVRTQLLMSGIAGLMLGVCFLHLFAHSVLESGSADFSAQWLVVGFVVMFLLLRAFHFHHHEPTSVSCPSHGDQTLSQGGTLQVNRHMPLNWTGLAVGLGIHTLIDGTALAASVVADSGTGGGGLPGVGIFLAVCLHKPLDALSITALMAAGGWPRRSQHLANLAFSMVCPIGAILFFYGFQGTLDEQHRFLPAVLAFAAGTFLCIALTDLIPELEFHSHDRLRLSCAFVAGLAVSYALRFVEPAHMHDHNEGVSRQSFSDGHEFHRHQ